MNSKNIVGLPPRAPKALSQRKTVPLSDHKPTSIKTAAQDTNINTRPQQLLKSRPNNLKQDAAPNTLSVMSNKIVPKAGQEKGKQNFQGEEFKELEPAKIAGSHENEIERAVDLSIRLNKKYIHSDPSKSQIFPMLVSLKTSDVKLSQKASIDLVCVIDTSSSMRGEKLNLVKNTFTYLLRFLSGKDRLSIITFDANATIIFPLVNVTDENQQSMMSAINEIMTDPGTNISRGMSKAFELLKARQEKNSVTSIFLLSDGVDRRRGALGRVQEKLKNCKLEEEVTIHTFGFGELHDSKVMTGIADLRDGNFYYIDALDTVDEAFVDCLGGLMSVIGQNISVTIKSEQSQVLQGVNIVKAYGDAGMWMKVEKGNQQEYVAKMTHLLAGKQKDFMLELEIPANKKLLQKDQKHIKVASVEVAIEGLDGQKIIKKAKLAVTLLNKGEAHPVEEDDKEVARNVYRVKAASIIETVRQLAGEGKYEEARALMNKFCEELRNSKLSYDEFIKNLMADTTKAMLNMDSEKFKKSTMHELTATLRSYSQQKSAITMKNSNQNSIQTELVEEVKKTKSLSNK